MFANAVLQPCLKRLQIFLRCSHKLLFFEQFSQNVYETFSNVFFLDLKLKHFQDAKTNVNARSFANLKKTISQNVEAKCLCKNSRGF